MRRIGILGAARIAPSAIVEPALVVEGVKITAVAARNIARAKVFCADHVPTAVATEYGELVQRADVDLVYIAGPPSTHAEWAVAALNAGKDVLLEKPSTLNAAQTRMVLAACKGSGKRCIEAFHYRYHPLFDRALEIVQSGELGDIQSLAARFDVPIPKSATEFRWNRALGGGSLMDLGCYPLHWVRSLMNSEPTIKDVTGIFDDGVDVSIEATLGFEGGVEANIGCSMAPTAGKFAAQLTVHGSNGSLSILNPLAPQLGSRFIVHSRNGERREPMPTRATYVYQLEAVLNGLESGAPLPTEGADTLAQSVAIDTIMGAAHPAAQQTRNSRQ